jgi:hypothetical protein
MRLRLSAYLMLGFCVLVDVGRAKAAATDDIQVTTSTQSCDGFAPTANSFIIYGKNSNTSRPIDATFQYDSNPSSQSFSLFDANVSTYTDHFPKNLQIRIAPGATVPIGCTINYRASSTPLSVTLVPITINVTGASYVNPSSPKPPSEDARAFSAFLLQTGFSACHNGSMPAGVLYLLNLHPYARLVVTITLRDAHGGTNDSTKQDLPPLSATRIGCSNGPESPVRVVTASLIYPPGQMTSSMKSSKKRASPSFVSPFDPK